MLSIGIQQVKKKVFVRRNKTKLLIWQETEKQQKTTKKKKNKFCNM